MFKKKGRPVSPELVIIPGGHPNPPELHEVDVAWLLARHYHTTVQFLIPVDDYKRKTADIIMFGVQWEIKSPVGDSKSTIGNQFQFAAKQSRSIILDTRRTKLDYENIIKKVQIEINKRSSIKRLLLIDKFGKIVEIKK